MKFQDFGFHASEVTAGTKRDAHGRTHGRTSQKQYAPPFFSKLGA